MEKKSWLWKRKSSDRSPGSTSESSGSTSSHSERYSDEQQEPVKGSPDHTPSPEVNSKLGIHNEEVNDCIKSLTEKLSAALVNVGAKEDLVKQHVKVAEEAVAGWEKAENEVASLKQQFEAAVQENLSLEVRANHLDSALKECVRQLRQAREEQEQRIHKAVAEKANEWEFTKLELESQVLELQNQADAAKAKCAPAIDPNVLLKLEGLESENSILKHELLSQSEDLEVRTIERDLSTHAAEMSSKQQLESIKKVAKLEAECRRLQAQLARKSSLSNDHKAVSTSSFYVDSLTDSQSDSGERLNSLEVDTRKLVKMEHSESEPSCSDSWASALIAELDQFKSGKTLTKIVPSSSVEIDIMDDFLEMERLAALPETNNKTHGSEVENAEHLLRAELEIMSHRVAELEDRLGKVEEEKAELENALNISQESLKASKALLEDNDKKIEDLQKELTLVNESKELLELHLVCMETEAQAMCTKVDSLKVEVERERSSSSEMIVKCQELEKELTRKTGEIELQHSASSNGELKAKQEELSVVAASRLAECQKTISSLATQLKSLATLEDFLIDTANLPGFSAAGSQTPRVSGESWNLHSNDAFMPKINPHSSKKHVENSPPAAVMNGSNTESPPSSSSSTSPVVSLNHHVGSAKTKNGFGKLFSRSKSGIQLENH